MTQSQELAGLIHKKRCHWNHMDQCGWDYESWDKPGSTRDRYLGLANTVLDEIPFRTAKRMLELI